MDNQEDAIIMLLDPLRVEMGERRMMNAPYKSGGLRKFKMKITSKLNLRYLFVFVVFLVSGCGHVSTGTWNQPFPAGDILFQSEVYDPYELNLIQADGTNHQTVNLPQNFVRPVWSANGEILYALSNLRGSYLMKIWVILPIGI